MVIVGRCRIRRMPDHPIRLKKSIVVPSRRTVIDSEAVPRDPYCGLGFDPRFRLHLGISWESRPANGSHFSRLFRHVTRPEQVISDRIDTMRWSRSYS